MSGGSTAGNIITDVPATYAARTWVDVTKQDFDVIISDAQLEMIVGANWFNNVDDNLIQLNAWLHGTGQATHIRAAQATIGTLSLTSAVVGSGAPSDAHANADDLVVGDLGATARGITLLSTSASTLAFTDSAGVMSGYITYTHASDTLTLGAAGNGVLNVNTSLVTATGGSESVSLGEASNLWAGVSAADIYGRDGVQIGDGTGSPQLTFDRDTAGVASVVFEAEGVAQWRLQHKASGDLSLDRYVGGALQDSVLFGNAVSGVQFPGNVSGAGSSVAFDDTDVVLVLGDGDGTPSIELAGPSSYITFSDTGVNRFFIGFDGSLSLTRIAGSDGLSIDDVDGGVVVTHSLRVGNNSVSNPLLVIDKAEAGTSSLTFSNENQARFAFLLDSSENLLLRAYSAGGASLRTVTFNNATGLWSLPNDITLTGTRTLTVGDGTGNQAIVVNKSAAGTGVLTFQDNGTVRWNIKCDASENLLFERYDSSGVLQDTLTVDQSTSRWVFPAAISLGGNPRQFTAGSGVPTGGADGDIYWRTSGVTAPFYWRTGGVWTAIT